MDFLAIHPGVAVKGYVDIVCSRLCHVETYFRQYNTSGFHIREFYI